MKNISKRSLLPLCLLMAPLFANAEGVIDDLIYAGTGTAGEPVEHACEANLIAVNENLGKINPANEVIIASPLGVMIQCATPQRVKFKFVDNSSTPNTSSNVNNYIMNDSDGGVVSGSVQFTNMTGSAGGTTVPLMYDANDNDSAGEATTKLARSGATYFGDKTAKSMYMLQVGRLTFSDLSDINIPSSQKDVAVGGTLEITYGF